LDPLAELDPTLFVAEPRLSLMLVITTNAVSGCLQRLADGGIDRTRPFQPSFATQDERLWAPAIEAFRILEYRLVAALTHGIENRTHVRLDAGEIFVAAPAQGR
jgi:hypothetical protein